MGNLALLGEASYTFSCTRPTLWLHVPVCCIMHTSQAAPCVHSTLRAFSRAVQELLSCTLLWECYGCCSRLSLWAHLTTQTSVLQGIRDSCQAKHPAAPEAAAQPCCLTAGTFYLVIGQHFISPGAWREVCKTSTE